MSNCNKEFEKLVVELRATTDAILKQAKLRIDNALADCTKKVKAVCSETFQTQMRDTMRSVQQEANRNLNNINKNVNKFVDDLRQYTK
ncbi:hypothetical protein Trydic_g7165 [Trypoxylus dichotomus]